MDSQHKKVTGYRELSSHEIDGVNRIKGTAKEVGILVEAMEADDNLDSRWIASGKDDLQKGFMALTRAVAKPDFF